MTIRSMTVDDLEEVSRIQRLAYGTTFLESDAVLHRRLKAAPTTAWVAQVEGKVQAYLVGYRSQFGCVTRLNGEFAVDLQAQCLYLHDLAVAPEATGRAIGPALVDHALDCARHWQWERAALVSVQGSLAFWRRRGFIETDLSGSEARAHLSEYGTDATYMSRSL